MSKRDEYISFINELKSISPTISDEQRKGLLRRAVQQYNISVDEAVEILEASGLVIGEEINYFEVLGLSIAEFEKLSEKEIAYRVETAHKKLYGDSLKAGGRPRADGKSEAEWRTVLNQARDVLTNPHRRQEHISEMRVEQAEESTTNVPLNSGAAITKPYIQIEDSVLSEHKGAVNSVAFSPDGTSIVSGSSDNTAMVWDVLSGTPKWTFVGHQDEVTSVIYSPDGKTIASGSHDRTVRLWDSDTGELKNTLTGHYGAVSSVAYSPDGKTLASGSHDRTVHLWDTISGELKNTFKGHSNRVSSVAYSPTGNTIASSSYDTTVRVWDVTKYSCRNYLDHNLKAVSSVVYSPDGKTIASNSLRTYAIL